MKTLIIYTSVHHGNTAKIARAMADELGAAMAKPSEVDASRIGEYDLIGFGSGIYNHSHHRALLDLADRLPATGKPVFIFSTRGYPKPLPSRGEDHRDLREKLTARGYRVTDEFTCKGWSTFYKPTRLIGGLNRGSPGLKELSRARDFARGLKPQAAAGTRIIDAGVTSRARAFILKGRKAVIVDTGFPGQAEKILETLRHNGIANRDVSLILLTHGHIDHYGNVRELQKALGAPVAMGKADAAYLTRGSGAPVVPTSLPSAVFARLAKAPPEIVKADVLVDDELDLKPYGVDAVAFATPGHTYGSLSVMVGDACLIGDLLMAAPAVGKVPGFPFFAEDRGLIGPSLKKVLDRGAQTIYPTHGEPCDAAIVREKMAALLG